MGIWKLIGLKLFFRSEEMAKAKLIIPLYRFCRDGMWMLLEATNMSKRISWYPTRIGLGRPLYHFTTINKRK